MADGASSATYLLAKIREERGTTRPWHEIAVRYAPAALERHHENVQAVMALPALDRRHKHLIIAAVDACKGWPGITVHIGAALDAGGTEDEIVEAMLVAAIPGGASVLAYGLEKLDEVLRTRSQDRRPQGED